MLENKWDFTGCKAERLSGGGPVSHGLLYHVPEAGVMQNSEAVSSIESKFAVLLVPCVSKAFGSYSGGSEKPWEGLLKKGKCRRWT